MPTPRTSKSTPRARAVPAKPPRRRSVAAAAETAAGDLEAARSPVVRDDAEGDMTGRIVDSITAAIVERRLTPGTKLAEQQIADIFKVSRTLVRQALNQLSRDHLVTLHPRRGAYVAQPGVEEARQVFAVRQMIETAMVRQLCGSITDAQIGTLRQHCAAERSAVARTDVPGRTRLLADFHVVMARMLGNEVLAELLGDLLSRSSLIALMYQSSHSAEHSQGEHEAIVDALERRDARAAAKLIEDHLGNVQQNLRYHPRINDLALALQAL